MGRLLALLGGWQGYAAAAALAALLAAGASYYLTALGYRLTIAQMEKAQANAAVIAATRALTQFEADSAAIHGAAIAFGTAQDDLNGKLATISKDFHAAIKAAPLPADCKPDAVRLRQLSAAVAATNSAAGFQPGAAVPAHP